ncbi:hypothetical protein [Desulfosporosinus shakirovi]|uniref:hypothetical protein n=1 Tax=Desulfosporosinus shakirovi TaxID=2885154 RepID=UPI001E41203F|nr:hypothetical protein [Desulfosporosinus sp. SRJS8]
MLELYFVMKFLSHILSMVSVKQQTGVLKKMKPLFKLIITPNEMNYFRNVFDSALNELKGREQYIQYQEPLYKQ